MGSKAGCSALILLAATITISTHAIQLFIGQDVDSIDAYVSYVNGGGAPAGVTTYTAIRDSGSLEGLHTTVNYGAGNICATCLLNSYPTAALAIGLDLVDTLASIAAGNHDGTVAQLAEFIKQTNRQVYLRIGYEAEMPHNRYDPTEYRAAFRRIVEGIRNNGATNIIFVWQLGTSAITYNGLDAMEWFPGSDVVDWVGGSYFAFEQGPWDKLLGLARAYGKRVMICEATPRGYDLREGTIDDGSSRPFVGATEQWNRWFGPFFAFIGANSDVIDVVAYISADWDTQSLWSEYWGDTSIEANGEIKMKWLDAWSLF